MTEMIIIAMPVLAILIVAVVGASAEGEAWIANRAWQKEMSPYRGKEGR